MTEAPTITTARLTLRGHRMSDWPVLRDALASPRAGFIGGPLAEQAAWNFFVRSVAPWPLMGFGAFAVDETGTGALVGQISLARHPWFPETEIGWFATKDGQGKGLISEAAAAVRDWAFAEAGLDTLVSYIDEDNVRSIALAERLGATPDPKAEARFSHHLVYRHSHPELAV